MQLSLTIIYTFMSLLENEPDDCFRATDKIHAVLHYLSKERTNEDNFPILNLSIEEKDIEQAVQKTKQLDRYYWAGKNITVT